jgi:hypothetical protein
MIVLRQHGTKHTTDQGTPTFWQPCMVVTIAIDGFLILFVSIS